MNVSKMEVATRITPHWLRTSVAEKRSDEKATWARREGERVVSTSLISSLSGL